MHRIGRLALVPVLAGTLLSAQGPDRPPDFAQASEEAVGFLQNLVRIDTSGGNETRAAEYIQT